MIYIYTYYKHIMVHHECVKMTYVHKNGINKDNLEDKQTLS
jgi:hypothetical protein